MYKNIRDYERLKQGEEWTGAFEKAVCDLAECGGGTLYVPSGRYVCGSILLKSNITLWLESGAQLLFSDDPDRYEIIMLSYIGKALPMYRPFIYAADAENVTIKGRGILDGQGMAWWNIKKELRERGVERPQMVCFENCRNVTAEGVSFRNAPSWTIHSLRCDDVQIHNIHIENPADSPNTHGIDLISSRNVRISDCIIDTGDDCITVKSGTEESENLKPSENIVIANCNFLHGHGGISVGSEMRGMCGM